jgi:beta-phosphoglucomutase
MKLLLQKYHAVIFDMDGVIADTNPYHRKAWEKFAEKYGLSITDADLKNNIYGRTNEVIFKFLFNKELPMEEVNKLSEEKETIFRSIYKDNVKPVKGLHKFLKKLKERNLKTAVATSAPKENVDFVLSELNIKSYFDVVMEPSKVKKSKPEPEIYLKAAELLSVNPVNCLVFEDSIPGISAALSAGMNVIGLMTTFSKDELNCNEVINDFDELDL